MLKYVRLAADRLKGGFTKRRFTIWRATKWWFQKLRFWESFVWTTPKFFQIPVTRSNQPQIEEQVKEITLAYFEKFRLNNPVML